MVSTNMYGMCNVEVIWYPRLVAMVEQGYDEVHWMYLGVLRQIGNGEQ